MKIVSWNVNGIRTLPQYHPWNTIKKCSGILQELGGDITCFQEVKSTRNQLTRDTAVPEPYDAFFSFPQSKYGYSGVATFAKPVKAPVIRAEEGLSRYLGERLKPPLASDERVSSYGAYPLAYEFDFMPDEAGNVPSDFAGLESEGRSIVTDFGRFVLINTYCPNESSEERLPFKVNYHRLLGERVRLLIQEGREVVVVGDINICADPIDHVEGDMGNNAAEFWNHPARAWFRDWIGSDGPMVDVIRKQWPERKSMYTCWNTKISARDSNYGTRIDYVLLTHGLLPWFKFGDIQPTIKGSDHCPIYVELHDEITSPTTGETMRLFEPEHFEKARASPRICTKNWPEFTGEQRLLSTFFGRKGIAPPTLPAIPSTLVPTTPTEQGVPLPKLTPVQPQSTEENQILYPKDPPSTLTPSSTEDTIESDQLKVGSKRKRHSEDAPTNKTTKTLIPRSFSNSSKTKPRPGQVSINTFFHTRNDETKASQSRSNCGGKSKAKTTKTTSNPQLSHNGPPSPQPTGTILTAKEHGLQTDLEFAQKLAEDSQEIAHSTSSSLEHRKSWSKFFTKHEPPKCPAHNELCKEFVTNKPGPNKGKYFWICSRPVGPGYDAGRSRRLREDVDPQYRCDFFKWSSEWRKEAMRHS